MVYRLRKNEKRPTSSEGYDGQECAEIRHTAAHSLDTKKVGHGRLFFLSVQYRIATICGIAASRDVHIHIHIHLYCSKHVYSDSPPKTNASAVLESLLDD